ncbi:MAG: sugar phosphate nucleotidyltransferase [Bacteroidota bacterium]
MKAVIPVAGAGTLLRPHTHTQPKPLVPVAGRPILGHIVTQLLDAGVEELVFITGYLGEKIEDYVRTEFSHQVKCHFVAQDPREGSAHAIWVAREYLQDEPELLIMLGDTIVEMDFGAFLRNPRTTVGIRKVAKPSFFGIAEMSDKPDLIKRLVEKPAIPKSNMGLVGVYKIKNVKLLFASIQYLITQNQRINGEFFLTDALQRMIEAGEEFTYQKVDQWYDCSQKRDLLSANAILLNKSQPEVHETADCTDSIIIPPVFIGANCKIEGSIVGPNVTIGANSRVHHSILSDSIIGTYSHLESAVLSKSIIGSDSRLVGLKQSLNIGDNTEINFMK